MLIILKKWAMASSLCSPKGPRVSFNDPPAPPAPSTDEAAASRAAMARPQALGAEGWWHWPRPSRGPDNLWDPKGPRDGGKPMAFPWKMIPMLANSQPKQWFLNWTYTKKGFRVSGKVLLCPSLEVKMKVSSAPMFVSSRKLMVEYGWTMMNLHTIKIQ